MQLSLWAWYFNLSVNNAWWAVSKESIEGGMHGWGDSCVTEFRGAGSTCITSWKYVVNVNGG